ncbi:hypothetical protein PRZ48_010226 [Zasmidium cellare]|uniref:Uncharacterized protein n=1 Tax=Zasmidium cellare TaxID=395010 RepID=A0ABR0EF08_ZASCE|nr:hypothetical protein PRZ48_010226 [Zasmidium cellare]
MKTTAPTLLALLSLATTVLGDAYCGFYSDSECTQQVGNGYSVSNSGCFQNNGGYIMCNLDAVSRTGPSFTLVQSPSNDGGCGCQSNCGFFNGFGKPTDDPYEYCTPINLTPGYTDFRIIIGGTCGANNC